MRSVNSINGERAHQRFRLSYRYRKYRRFQAFRLSYPSLSATLSYLILEGLLIISDKADNYLSVCETPLRRRKPRKDRTHSVEYGRSFPFVVRGSASLTVAPVGLVPMVLSMASPSTCGVDAQGLCQPHCRDCRLRTLRSARLVARLTGQGSHSLKWDILNPRMVLKVPPSTIFKMILRRTRLEV